MVNQTAIATSAIKAEKDAVALCESTKLTFANNFARAEAEKYRKASGYDEIKFNEIKNKISENVKKSIYPLTKEFSKTIQINENSYKIYAQYSIDKGSIQNSLIDALKSDEVLYSRLKASMAFDELEDDDF